MSLFLSADELQELTGFRLKSKQVEWLQRYRWRFALNASGEPRVARAYLASRLGGDGSAADGAENRRQPRFDMV